MRAYIRRVGTDADGEDERIAFECTRCQGHLSRHHGSLQCRACGFVPRHGAD